MLAGPVDAPLGDPLALGVALDGAVPAGPLRCALLEELPLSVFSAVVVPDVDLSGAFPTGVLLGVPLVLAVVPAIAFELAVLLKPLAKLSALLASSAACAG